MRQIWHDILTHRPAASLFALCWVGAWAITVVMWRHRDEPPAPAGVS